MSSQEKVVLMKNWDKPREPNLVDTTETKSETADSDTETAPFAGGNIAPKQSSFKEFGLAKHLVSRCEDMGT